MALVRRNILKNRLVVLLQKFKEQMGLLLYFVLILEKLKVSHAEHPFLTFIYKWSQALKVAKSIKDFDLISYLQTHSP